MPDIGRDAATVGILDERSAGGRLVASDGRPLPLRGVTLSVEARGGLARAVLEQRFVNPHAEPLRVSYLVPLPVDGALAGYAVRIGERRIVGEVDRISAARGRFEAALLEGRSAGLVEQERPNLFTLELGNVPPSGEVVAELTLEQRLAWLDEGAWEWRFPTVVAPRYLGADGRVPDAERVTVDVTEAPVTPRAKVTLLVRDTLAAGGAPTSPSHALAVAPATAGLAVTVGEDAVALDRDVVVRWPVAGATTALALDTARPPEGRAHAGAAYALLTVVPPSPETHPVATPRDLSVLIDTSGSMAGEPLAQAKTVARALVQSLGEADRLEMIEFSNQPRRWRRGAERVTEAMRTDALAWLDALQADGSTEMRDAVAAALRPLRHDAQRQTVLITDGLIGFENELVRVVAQDLPPGSRLHTVGVGSSVNRALTTAAARAGRGAEIVVGLDEDVTPAVARLLARTRSPLLTDITLCGSALLGQSPSALPDVYAGAPLRAALKLSPDSGDLIVQGCTPAGAWESRLAVAAIAAGQGNPAVVSLYGRETVEDLEVRGATGEQRVDAEIERVGLEFQIATRLTSWVAVAEEPAVDPTQPMRRERIPHALPHGLSIEGLGLRDQMVEVGAFTGVGRKVAVSRLQMSMLAAPAAPYSPFRPFRQQRAGTVYRRPRLTARLVLRSGRELTFEVAVETAFEWEPSGAVVAWPDGTSVRAEVVEQQTTAAGPVKAGMTLRVSLRLEQDGPKDVPRQLLLGSPRGALRITVHRA